MKAMMLLALLYIAAFAQQKGTFTDTRDGKTYKTTKIGSQVWMAENLNFNAVSSRCYGNDPANCDKYGRLYDWKTALTICPSGWHLPSNEEWDKLYCFADGTSGMESLSRSKTAGKFLKATSGWNDYEGKSGNGEDKFSFSALPGGFCSFGGFFFYVGMSYYLWSSSEYDNRYAYSRRMYYSNEGAYRDFNVKGTLQSVRCVGD